MLSAAMLIHAGVFLLGAAGGYYAHYKFGASVAKDAQVIKTAVDSIKKA